MVKVDTLFIRYGARIAEGAAEVFYDRVYDEPSLAPFFRNIEKHAMKEHMASFLTDLTGGPAEYTGRDLRVAHGNYAIGDADYDLICHHMAASLQDVGISPEDTDALMQVIESHRTEIVKSGKT